VGLVDCTFSKKKQALERVRKLKPSVLGIYSMISMEKDALMLAEELRNDCQLLVAGGPHPTVDPSYYSRLFDIVVMGEGEKTMGELVGGYRSGRDFSSICGIAYCRNGELVINGERPLVDNLDSLPRPAREMYPNQAYQTYWKQKLGIKPANIMTTRGCPYSCEYCSKPVFGDSYREKSVAKVMEEIEDVLRLGFDYVFFSDDCFTLNQARTQALCQEIRENGLHFKWSLLSRTDTVDLGLVKEMKEAGCDMVFLGLESGDDRILRLMRKATTVAKGRNAVHMFKEVGIRVGAFFMLGYPGEDEENVINTLRFACSLPLDYLSFTLPYPIPGTRLHQRTLDLQGELDWARPKLRIWEHRYYFRRPFSESKLKFAMLKGKTQYLLNKQLGSENILSASVERVTDKIFRML
jgi:anaerobic magnesium-protoporphyrin IX monomethyl ester cyclase